MKYDFALKGVCSSRLELELDGDIIRKVKFTGGCNGNLKALAALTEGMTVEQVRERLLGITCGFKDTSCSDQLAKALLKALESEKKHSAESRIS